MRHIIALIISIIFTFPVAETAQNPRPRSPSSVKERMQKQENEPERESYCPSKEERGSFCLGKLNVSVARGCTALMRAAEGGRLGKVRVLLASGSDVNAKLPHGQTALMLAAAEGHLEIVKVLLAARANPNSIGSSFHYGPFAAWMSAMDRCNKRRVQIMEAMIAGGVEINPKITIYLSPLGHAIRERDPVMIKALLKRGADVNLGDSETGETPLMFAVKYSSPEVVKALIAAGADVNARNKEGNTALTLMEEYGENLWRKEIVQLLKEAGAKR